MPPGGPPAAPPPGAPFSAAGGPPRAIPPSGPCACAALRPRASTTLAPPSKIFLTFMTVLHTRLRTPIGVSPGNIARLSLFPRETKIPSLVGADQSPTESWCEQAEAEAAGGKPLNIGEYARATNTLRRLLLDLGLEARLAGVGAGPLRTGRGLVFGSAPSGSRTYLGEDHGRRRKTPGRG